PLVRRLHANTRGAATRGEYRRTQSRRRRRQVVGTDRFELSASASQTQRSNQAELRPVRSSVGVGFAPVEGPLVATAAEPRLRRPVLGFAMVFGAATLFGLNGPVAKVALASGLSSFRLTDA